MAEQDMERSYATSKPVSELSDEELSRGIMEQMRREEERKEREKEDALQGITSGISTGVALGPAVGPVVGSAIALNTSVKNAEKGMDELHPLEYSNIFAKACNGLAGVFGRESSFGEKLVDAADQMEKNATGRDMDKERALAGVDADGRPLGSGKTTDGAKTGADVGMDAKELADEKDKERLKDFEKASGKELERMNPDELMEYAQDYKRYDELYGDDFDKNDKYKSDKQKDHDEHDAMESMDDLKKSRDLDESIHNMKESMSNDAKEAVWSGDMEKMADASESSFENMDKSFKDIGRRLSTKTAGDLSGVDITDTDRNKAAEPYIGIAKSLESYHDGAVSAMKDKYKNDKEGEQAAQEGLDNVMNRATENVFGMIYQGDKVHHFLSDSQKKSLDNLDLGTDMTYSEYAQQREAEDELKKEAKESRYLDDDDSLYANAFLDDMDSEKEVAKADVSDKATLSKEKTVEKRSRGMSAEEQVRMIDARFGHPQDSTQMDMDRGMEI